MSIRNYETLSTMTLLLTVWFLPICCLLHTSNTLPKEYNVEEIREAISYSRWNTWLITPGNTTALAATDCSTRPARMSSTRVPFKHHREGSVTLSPSVLVSRQASKQISNVGTYLPTVDGTPHRIHAITMAS
jgi:hypothetical protein